MLPFFRSKTILKGTDLREFNEMREFLKKHNVKHNYKVNNQSGRWSGGGSADGIFGSLGTRDLDSNYEIRVRKKDAKRLGL